MEICKQQSEIEMRFYKSTYLTGISVRSSMKGFPKCFSLSLHRAGRKQRRCSTVSSSSSSLQLLQKSFCGAFSLPVYVTTSQWTVGARISMPHSVRLSLSNSEVFFVVYHRPCLVRAATLWCVLPMGVG